ncbi:MAG: hypothetical protein U0Y82_05555 [Thermoleophilia bacterium]
MTRVARRGQKYWFIGCLAAALAILVIAEQLAEATQRHGFGVGGPLVGAILSVVGLSFIYLGGFPRVPVLGMRGIGVLLLVLGGFVFLGSAAFAYSNIAG